MSAQALIDAVKERTEKARYKKGLTLTKEQEAYLDQLMKHNWLYFMLNDRYEYAQAVKQQAKLKERADRRQGNFTALYQRVYDYRVNQKEVRHG